MTRYKYSFIIPHHNQPDLLNRCICSIPQRNDIEIIVVDDNSDADRLPKDLRNDVKLIKIKKEDSKGAGKARNVGLKAASGEWILFADSDDFYVSGFVDILDRFSTRDIDMLCYDVFYAYDLESHSEKWANRYSNAIKEYLEEPTAKNLIIVKHIIQSPWNFMVRREIPLSHGIEFEELPKGNDAYFHHIVSMACDKVEVINNKLYYWLWTPGSITHKKQTKQQLFDGISRFKKITLLRVKARAWTTIPPLTRGFKSMLSNYGLATSIYYIIRVLLSGIPWCTIWWHKALNH